MTINTLKPIKNVAIIGANGTMGALSAGIIASFGDAKVFMLARDLDKANEGINKAVFSLKTEVIKNNLIPCTYQKDLEKAVSKSDWILEALPENYEIKEEMGKKIAGLIKPDAIISTVSSGLSINKLSQTYRKKDQDRYFGTHFFNPPYKMLLLELVYHKNSNQKLMKMFGSYLENVLRRKVVYVSDSPAFAGNRISFQLMNEVAQLAEKYQKSGGIKLLDIINGRYTGKALPPLATLDLVGLDTYSSIINNLYQNTNDLANQTFKLPKFVSELIEKRRLGNKTGEGFYKKIVKDDGTKELLVYNINAKKYEKLPEINLPFINNIQKQIYVGNYQEAIDILKTSKEQYSDLARYFICRYISYSLSLVGTVVTSIEMIDMVMAYGFNWIPPSALIKLFGGVSQIKKLLKDNNLPIPEILTSAKASISLNQLNKSLDYRSFLKN